MCVVAFVCIPAVAYRVTQLSEYKFPNLETAISTAMTLIKQEWILMLLITLSVSGVIGFGTAALAYRSVEVKVPVHSSPVHLRCVTAAYKQAVQRLKAQSHPMHKLVRRPSLYIPPLQVRDNLYHHSRFSNISRPYHREPPNLKQIKYLKDRMRQLASEIQLLQRMIGFKQREYEKLKEELNQLKCYGNGPPKKARIQKCPSTYNTSTVHSILQSSRQYVP